MFFMFRSSKFPVQVTGRFLTIHLINAADARNVDGGLVSSETEYFQVSGLQKLPRDGRSKAQSGSYQSIEIRAWKLKVRL